ncbi:3-dehydroquinate synthase [Rubritalea tangerina]|uniref:3-dehydroquinate synthase n=1 Tax=Rubritalea tangerina TaxID=430798 RepID=A0ABW4ZCB6_9BACT
MANVQVDLGTRSYEVLCDYGLLDQAAEKIKAIGLSGKAAIISDSNVSPIYSAALCRKLEEAGYATTIHEVPAGEASKSLTNCELLCRELTQQGHDRSSFVIALGGGVVGDLAGFVASIFYRGVPFVQIPTTIVSLVDSSVGGKTGVNIPEGKNLVGAFHQPKLVLADPATLASLPGREYREGYAEAIKHAAIRDLSMFDALESISPEDQAPPADLIARNIAIKARVVEEDEKETAGTRALLNFGHTIGHGIEAAVPYGTLLHGEAISLGIVAALKLSEQYADLSPEDSARVIALLEKFQLPLTLDASIRTEVVLEKMKRDKKFSGGNIKFVLLRQLGDAFVSDQVTWSAIEEAIEGLR